MPVFFVPPQCITPPTVSVTGELFTHLRDSLRIEVGETILVADGEDRRYRTEITAITKQSMTGRVIDVIPRPSRRAPSLILGQALVKGEKMDWVIQKTTELGVQTIIPIQSRQSIVQFKADRIQAQTARWQRIALEAAQQSEQWHVPTIASSLHFSSCMTQISAHSLALILTERRDQIRTLASIALPAPPEASILVLIGPEGGWREEEVATAEKAGCIPITLGPKILRAETAAMLAIGILQHRLGELG
ncbi:MAG: 16S rRNA (uracil(1498)-N(3))-methyltransferase [Nitrospirae bacterium]|nr:16S rRNA (uracil(1498)-N(3))-methyltransferase [Nitrospirota bacterium]